MLPITSQARGVEKTGIEPVTSGMRHRRSPNVSYIPKKDAPRT